jgi:hypothetical protein
MILAILSTVVVYLVLQRVDDNRRERKNQPLASWGQRIGLLFFVAIVCFVATYLLENMNEPDTNQSAYVHGGSYEKEMLKSIHEPIHTGMPPF